MITFGAEGLYWHPDHIAVHELVCAAFSRALDGTGTALYAATWPCGLAGDLVARMKAQGLPAYLWGLPPDAFGVSPETITTVVDVHSFAAVKLRALRAHGSQLGAGHLLAEVPAELAAELLGREYFVLLEGERDALPELAHAGAEEMRSP